MLPLLLALLAHPAGEPWKIGCLEGARHREVQVGGVELVLDLLAHRVPYRTLHRRLRVLVYVPFSPFVFVPEHGLYPFLQALVRKEAWRVLIFFFRFSNFSSLICYLLLFYLTLIYSSSNYIFLKLYKILILRSYDGH